MDNKYVEDYLMDVQLTIINGALREKDLGFLNKKEDLDHQIYMLSNLSVRSKYIKEKIKDTIEYIST